MAPVAAHSPGSATSRAPSRRSPETRTARGRVIAVGIEPAIALVLALTADAPPPAFSATTAKRIVRATSASVRT